MNNRIHSFYKKELQICKIMMIIGIVFGALYFTAEGVAPQYTYFFYTLVGFGLIYIFNYGYRLIFYRKRFKEISQSDPQSSKYKSELEWMEFKIKEVERFRLILQVLLAIGGIMILIGFAGYMKQLVASSGLGLLLGGAIWFAAELFSELHLKEYQQFLEK